MPPSSESTVLFLPPEDGCAAILLRFTEGQRAAMDPSVPFEASCFALWSEVPFPEAADVTFEGASWSGGGRLEVRGGLLFGWAHDILSPREIHLDEGVPATVKDISLVADAMAPAPIAPPEDALFGPDAPLPILFFGTKSGSGGMFVRRRWFVDHDATAPYRGTREQPWKSLWPVRLRLLLGFIRPGDVVCFRRGRVWSVFSEALDLEEFEREMFVRIHGEPWLMAPILASLEEVERSFFQLDTAEGAPLEGKFTFLSILPRDGVDGLDDRAITFSDYGSGQPPTFQGPLAYAPPSTWSSVVDGTLGDDGEGWPLAGIFTFKDITPVASVAPYFGLCAAWPQVPTASDFPWHDWVGLYLLDVSRIRVQNLRLEGFNYGVYAAGACRGLEFTHTTFRFMEDKGVAIGALPDAGYRPWNDTEGHVAGYDWRSGHYPEDILFSHCDFAHIGQYTSSNAILLSWLTTGVEVDTCTFRWCVDGIAFNGCGTGHKVHGCTFANGVLSQSSDHGDGDGLDIQNVRPRTETSWTAKTAGVTFDPCFDPSDTVALADFLANWEVRKTEVYDCTFRLLPGRSVEVQHGSCDLEFYRNRFENCQIGIRIHVNGMLEAQIEYRQDQWDPGGLCAYTADAWSAWDGPTDADGVPLDWAWVDLLTPLTSTTGDTVYVYTTESIRIYRNLFYTTSDLNSYRDTPTVFNEPGLRDASGRRYAIAASGLSPGQEAAITLLNKDFEHPLLVPGEWRQVLFRDISVLNNTVSGMTAGGRFYSNTGKYENVGWGLKIAETLDVDDPRVAPLFSDVLVANNIFANNVGWRVGEDYTGAEFYDDYNYHWRMDGIDGAPRLYDSTTATWYLNPTYESVIIERNYYTAQDTLIEDTDIPSLAYLDCDNLSSGVKGLSHLQNNNCERAWIGTTTTIPGDPLFDGTTDFGLDPASPCVGTAFQGTGTADTYTRLWNPLVSTSTTYSDTMTFPAIPYIDGSYAEIPVAPDYLGDSLVGDPDIGAREQ